MGTGVEHDVFLSASSFWDSVGGAISHPLTLIAAGTVGSAAVLVPVLVAPLLRSMSLFDRPNSRSSHDVPTLRGGGLVLILASGIGVLLARVMGFHVGFEIPAGASILGLVGFFEDRIGLRIVYRLTSQLVVATGVAVVFAYSGGWSSAAAVLIAVPVYTNTVNFMDGIDGITSMHAVAVGAFFATAGWSIESEALMTAGVLLAATALGFLPWNVAGRGLFLGDSGSYFVGSWIAISFALALQSGLSLVAAGAPASIYLADTGSAILRRWRSGESLYTPHRRHVYQRLVDRGYNHLAVALLVTVLTLAATLIAWFAASAHGWMISPFLVAWIGVVAAYLAMGAPWSRDG